MKTTDLFKADRSAKKLNESLAKTFGKKLNLEAFDMPQLEDARNKLRTQIHTARSQSGFNENVENEALTQAQWMLDAINAELAERQELIADAHTAEADYEGDFEEGAEFGAYTDEKIAQMVYNDHPDLPTDGRASEFFQAAFPYMVKVFGSRKTASHYLNYDEDFPSDLVSSYAWLQKNQGNANAEESTAVEGYSSEVEDVLHKIANAGDAGYDMLQAGIDGDYGREVADYLIDMYNDIAGDFRLDPDDDFERIQDIMMDQFEADYKESDADVPQEAATNEVAPPGDKYERMVKHIKKGYAKDGKLTPKEKSIAYATAWKAKNKNESIEGEDMTTLREGEVQQAQSIVSAKTMVDRVGRWIEDLSGMENDTLLTLGDQIRDEMSADMAKNFISQAAPALQQAIETLKQTRDTLAGSVRILTGEEQGAEMIGAEPEMGGEDEFAAEPDAMNAEPELGGEEEMGAPEDEFAAAEPAAGGLGDAGRAKRESIEFGNSLLKVLAG